MDERDPLFGGRMDSGEICSKVTLNGRRQGCFQKPILGFKISVKWTHFQPKGVFLNGLSLPMVTQGDHWSFPRISGPMVWYTC